MAMRKFKVGDRVKIKHFAGGSVSFLGCKTANGVVSRANYNYNTYEHYIHVQIESQDLCCLPEELELLPDIFELWQEI